MSREYVYLIREREFIRLNENTYKVGKSVQTNNTRILQYPNGSELIIQIVCFDCSICEKNIIRRFKELFNHKKEYGKEYFEGDEFKMMGILIEEAKNSYEYTQSEFECEISDSDSEPNVESKPNYVIPTIEATEHMRKYTPNLINDYLKMIGK